MTDLSFFIWVDRTITQTLPQSKPWLILELEVANTDIITKQMMLLLLKVEPIHHIYLNIPILWMLQKHLPTD